MFFDLVDEDDGVADNHAEEGEHAEVGDEAERGVGDEHGKRNADEPHRCGEEGERHLAHAAELEHEQGHDDKDHGGQRLHEVVHGVGGVRERARCLDGCAGGEAAAQLLGRFVNAQRGIVALALSDLRLYHDAWAQVVPLDKAVLRAIREVGDLREGDAAARCRNRQLAEAFDVRAVTFRKAQDDADIAVARVELCCLCARQLGVEHLLDCLCTDPVKF